ncbi:MAG: glycosyltransferase family 2 protein [Ignavibacteriaceae bacterium]|jgi:GT2 family glycosyltransferase|nr:glycosyltransferase family 2 protein [Ignavibacteriaceae bacterium]MCW8817966.1 glycosyltransferase family 2 protein [Ignavibacteriaceae bacterium]MCW8823371.1 glycosyltransferase family 2 protein [Ignavibacteriaceae bacterium]
MEKQVQELEIDVSVIIVNYNSTVLLKNCLNSVNEFTKELNYEIIVVDNNSVEGDIEKQLKNCDRIKLIKNDINKGFGAANNQGVKISKGKYVLFLNNDTVLFENSIKKVFEYAESVNEKCIIGCKLLNEDRSLQKSVYDFPTLLNVFTSNFFLYLLFPKSKYFNKYHLMNRGINEVTKVDVVTGAFLFLRRKTFIDLSAFDERFFFYMEDTDLCYRHKKNSGKIIYYPETSIIHLKGKSAKGESWFKNKYRSFSTVKYFQKHFHGPEFYLSMIIHHIGLFIRSPLFVFAGVLSFNKDLIKRGFYSFLLVFIYPSNQFKN